MVSTVAWHIQFRSSAHRSSEPDLRFFEGWELRGAVLWHSRAYNFRQKWNHGVTSIWLESVLSVLHKDMMTCGSLIIPMRLGIFERKSYNLDSRAFTRTWGALALVSRIRARVVKQFQFTLVFFSVKAAAIINPQGRKYWASLEGIWTLPTTT